MGSLNLKNEEKSYDHINRNKEDLKKFEKENEKKIRDYEEILKQFETPPARKNKPENE